MKKIVHTIIRGSIAFVFAVAPALAANNDPGVDQREINQQNRINQGIQRGQLTPREAGKLEAQQARIKQKEDRMAARNGGNLTSKDKAKLTRKQNKASSNIYTKKHNDQTADVGK